MNIFNQILIDESAQANRLGCPLYGDANLRRAQRMYEMTGGKGFRVYPGEPGKDAQGKTRGQRKREARAAANLKETNRQMSEAKKLIDRGLPAHQVHRQFGSLWGE